MAKRYVKSHSILLIFREIQINSEMSYHLTSVKMIIIKSPQKENAEEGVKLTFLHC